MRGITAALISPQPRPPEEWDELYGAITRNLIFHEDESCDATGLAVVQMDGRMRVYRQSMPVSRFVHTRDFHELLRAVGVSTTLILGQTYACSVNKLGHAHPFRAGTVIGVHEGEVTNALDLFVRWNLRRHTDADTEIIFRRLAMLSPEMLNGDYMSCVASQLAEIEGDFAFLALDRRQPSQLLAFYRGVPLYTYFDVQWEALFFSTNECFIRNAFDPPIAGHVLPEEQLLRFNTDRIPDWNAQSLMIEAV